ncbi:glycosyltransferase [Legionella taurinensis]|uniref:glycosyltransferase n=1 Tax=Legionella taurinensis TaxID=70611 RepID=UPI0010569348|nr:glycosyltransferase [Legionella taurinensis]MDX1837995.1 glycosyltransferase [Legionella taurinensis]
MEKFDAIVIHYSSSLVNDYYISPQSKLLLRNYPGLKIMFIQDEYRLINKIISEIDYLNIDVLFTCFPEEEMDRIYCPSKLPSLAKYSNLTGYIPQRLLDLSSSIPPISQRQIDVGYRSRKVPFWLGQLGYEKWHIVEQWNQYVGNDTRLSVDISYNEQDRIYGERWIQFLLTCKTTLGVESGASVMDFTGQLQTLVDFHQATYPEDSFEKIQKIYLSEFEGLYKLNQISPRCFEAIALKTVLVLYEGDYSGILIPDKHYIPLKKDFSNITEVINKIKNIRYLQDMADRAYEDIALNRQYHYSSFVHRFDELISLQFKLRNKIQVNNPYQLGEFTQLLKIPKKRIQPHFKIKGFIQHKLSRVMHITVNQFAQISLLRKLKFFLTQRVVIFNPLLRVIKRYILQLI